MFLLSLKAAWDVKKLTLRLNEIVKKMKIGKTYLETTYVKHQQEWKSVAAFSFPLLQ